MNKQETITDIIAEMRGIRVREFQDYADRLEAAHKREVATTKESLAVGNSGDAAKLREALVSVQKKIHYLIGSLNVPNSLVANRMEINGIINAALAAPPRNCDKYSHDEALQVWASEKGNEHNGCFDEWLYEIAKDGGVK